MSTPTKPEPEAGAPRPAQDPSASQPPKQAKHYPPPPPPRPAQVNRPVPQAYAPPPTYQQPPAYQPPPALPPNGSWQPGAVNPQQMGPMSASPGYGQPYGTPPPAQQGYGMPPAPFQQQPYGAQAIVPHWALSIVSVLFSGIIGIVALYFSAQVQPRLVAGNVAGADDASKKAKIIAIVGIVIGVLAAMVVFSGSGSS